MNNYINLSVNYNNDQENIITNLIDTYNGEILDYYESEKITSHIYFNNFILFDNIESDLDIIRQNNSNIRYVLFSINNKNEKYRVHINKKGKKIITKNPVRIIGL